MNATTDTHTLATPANIRRFAELHPGRDVAGGGRVEGRRCFAYSPTTGEEFSGTAGDYFTHADDEALTDCNGDPMILAVTESRVIDALTGEVV